MTMFRSVILSLSLLSLVPSAALAATPYPDFLEHIVAASDRVVFASGALDVDALIELADEEIGWALANPPEECYAVAWGLWLMSITYIQTLGFAMDAMEPLTATAVTSELGTLPDAYGAATDAAVVACS